MVETPFSLGTAKGVLVDRALNADGDVDGRTRRHRRTHEPAHPFFREQPIVRMVLDLLVGDDMAVGDSIGVEIDAALEFVLGC
jgi:hypothetical protein